MEVVQSHLFTSYLLVLQTSSITSRKIQEVAHLNSKSILQIADFFSYILHLSKKEKMPPFPNKEAKVEYNLSPMIKRQRSTSTMEIVGADLSHGRLNASI